MSRVVIYKFGSSVLTHAGACAGAAEEVDRAVASGARVVAVVSALAGVTDGLLAQAARVAPVEPPPDLVAHLLSTGEEASAALLAMAVVARGHRVRRFGAAQIGLRTAGDALDSVPVDLCEDAVRRALERGEVCVVPGFVGTDAAGEPTLLGRGGSDLTALFLAHRLGGECRLVKDVDGIHPSDPRTTPGSQPLPRATWDQVLRIGGDVVQEKALRFARDHGLAFRVLAPGGRGTWVGRP